MKLKTKASACLREFLSLNPKRLKAKEGWATRIWWHHWQWLRVENGALISRPALLAGAQLGLANKETTATQGTPQPLPGNKGLASYYPDKCKAISFLPICKSRKWQSMAEICTLCLAKCLVVHFTVQLRSSSQLWTGNGKGQTEFNQAAISSFRKFLSMMSPRMGWFHVNIGCRNGKVIVNKLSCNPKPMSLSLFHEVVRMTYEIQEVFATPTTSP